MLKRLKIVTQTLAIISYVIIFGFVLILAPMVFGWMPIVIQSPSMEPSIKTGSIVYYNKNIDEKDLKVGDVITFKNDAKAPLVTHRLMIIENETKTVRTMGDANGVLDQNHLPIKNIIGKVGTLYLPKVGFYITYMQNPVVITVFAGIIVSNIVVGYFLSKNEGDEEEN
ncbi:MAG: signal peptidase I [Longicatena sp.]